jgi:hypothetical protein
MENEIQEIAEKIQKDCHKIVEAAWKPNPKESAVNAQLQYQDCMNVAIFRKMAEMQLQINNLSKQG